MLSRDSYSTVKPTRSVAGKLFGWSSIYFHYNLFKYSAYWITRKVRCNKGCYDDIFRGSWRVIDLIERCGSKVHISGIEHIKNTQGPVIFVSNHMSSLEPLLLPSMIMSSKKMTYILKESLLETRYMKEILSILDCIGVTRKDPIGDFKTILKEGIRHIKEGTSIVVFPQTTRTTNFDPEQFGTVGVKLAKRAGIPIIPIAVKTDFLENGKFLKDFGPTNRKNEVYLKAGAPITVEGNGKEAHEEIIKFIQTNLTEWGVKL